MQLVRSKGGFLVLPHSPVTIAPPTPPSFTPADLDLTGWWKPDYPAAPWASSASAGSSGTAGNLIDSVALYPGFTMPASTEVIPGFFCADFNGVDDVLISETATADTLFSAAAGSMAILFYASAATADAANWYGNPQLFGHGGSAVGGRVGAG